VNDTDALYPVVTRIPYPKAGTTNSAVRIGVVTADDRHDVRWMNTPGDPRDTYLARLEWLDARTVAIQQLNRLQNRNDLLLADARTGTVRGVFSDESKSWVELMEEVRWIDGGRAFSGSASGRLAARVPCAARRRRRDALTRFGADVMGLAGVDEAGGWLYSGVAGARDRALPLDRSWTGRERGGVTPRRRRHARLRRAGRPPGVHTYSRFDRPRDRGGRSAGSPIAARSPTRGRSSQNWRPSSSRRWNSSPSISEAASCSTGGC
jgi:hypothetical protein